MNVSFCILLIIKLYLNKADNFDKHFTKKIKKWEPDLLYEYTKKYYLNNNKEKNENLKHMIVDPENYLINDNISDIEKGMKLLYDKFNINNYIFIISNITMRPYRNKSKEIDPEKEMDLFLSKFNYIMYRENNFYEDNMTLMCIIFIDEAKI